MLFDSIINFLKLQEILYFKHKVFVRGGCAVGDAFHNSEFLFGPAVNKAYYLESKKADYQRIIVEEETLNYCVEDSMNTAEEKEYCMEKIKKYLKKDDDGYFYLDYLSLPMDISKEHVGDAVENMNILRILIAEGRKHPREEVSRKYDRLAKRFNESFTSQLVDFYYNNFYIDLNVNEAIMPVL